ncbi:MAG: polysaccharide deacetylase family protein [Acidimicrobiales bacterium]
MKRLRIYFVATSLAALLIPGLLIQAGPARAATTTYVSLTFDDGRLSQINAAALLDANGVRGTFYVNSNKVGAGGKLTLSQLNSMQGSGHEIGGHSLDHADLTAVSTDEATRQICADQQQLQTWGFPAISFAYPFGRGNSSTRTIVRDCKSRGYAVTTNYRSARLVGGLQCNGCPQAESVPPADPYNIRTHYTGSPTSSTTLDQLKAMVTGAEATGGWISIPFHSVCQAPGSAPVPGDASDCSADTYNTSYDVLDQFVKWLKSRSSLGTSIKTAAEVMGLLSNPSFETDANADGAPDCFRLDGYGTNSYSYARVTGGRTGTYAERLTITSLTSGDRKISTGRDPASCTMRATVGKTYGVGGWFKADQPVRIVAYYRDAAGVWQNWGTSAYAPASSTWTQIQWTTPSVPAGADIWSFGLTLSNVGTMTVDDYSAKQN